jgi:hypothetical protein
MSAAAPVPSPSVQEELPENSEKSQPSETVSQEGIARLAYALWQARGCPDGSPEQDWFAAEQQIRASQTLSASRQVSEKIGPASERRLLTSDSEAEIA